METTNIESPENFVATYNGYVTIENPATGAHRTFSIKSEVWNADTDREVRKRVVALLTGPDRASRGDWARFADVRDDGFVHVWKSKSSDTFEAFRKMLNNPQCGEALGLNYMFEGCCRRCNRRLSNPESIRSGIGPVCAGKG